MAMFVLVVDTSLMNVSISAVIKDLDTTASGVQSAIALEALVSAAFILINSKVGDLIGRKRAYVLGLLGYAVGALAMTLAQSLTAIIIFWAIIGGLGASLLLPAMQSLIHGNFTGEAQKQAYALVGAAAAIAAAVGPLLGGFVTTYLSWRVGFGLEVVIIAIVLSQIRLVRDVPYTGSRQVDVVGAVLSVLGMGGVVLGVLVWQEGGEYVGLLIVIGARRALGAGPVAGPAQARGAGDAARPRPVPAPELHGRGLAADAAADHARRGDDRAAAVPADDPRVQRPGGRPVPGPAVADHVRGGVAGRAGGREPTSGRIIRAGFVLQPRDRADHPVGPAGGQRLVPRDPARHHRLRARSAGVPAQQLHARAGRGGAGQRGRRRELGRRVVRAVVRARRGRRDHARHAVVQLHPQDREQHGHPAAQQQQIAATLEDDAEVMSNTQLEQQIAGEPPAVEAEVLSINNDAPNISLQVALLVPLLAGLLGLGNSFRMLRLPEVTPSASAEGATLG